MAELDRVAQYNSNVTGDNSVGGLVGYFSGTIKKSISSGTLTSRQFLGGLAGIGAGNIEDSHAIASLVETQHPISCGDVGGLVGIANSIYLYVSDAAMPLRFIERHVIGLAEKKYIISGIIAKEVYVDREVKRSVTHDERRQAPGPSESELYTNGYLRSEGQKPQAKRHRQPDGFGYDMRSDESSKS
jgi:hypothetical protein